MSLRAKCLPQKSGLQLSATKQTTFNTSMKNRTALKHRLGREKPLSTASKNNQLTKPRPTRTIDTHRNGRAILKRTTTTKSSATTQTSKNKEKVLFKEKQGATAKNKTSKTKTCTRTKLGDNSSSSVICSRSGRKLVPARCACANDSVTTRCSIHNNVRQTAASNTIKLKLSQNSSTTTKKKSQQLLLR